MRADRWPAIAGDSDARPVLDASDRSVQVHACHGRARQVEVLRDAILHLLDEDATLEPRDVIVMCPDIETFAPLIQATFGAGDVFEDDDELEALPADVRPPDLRVRLADRSLRQTNPVLGVVARLLDLVDERLTASQVLDLADREPVRRRFGLDDDDLARIEDWVAASGIRWGLDAAHRAPFKLEALDAGTWRAGVDRLLVGVTMTEDEQRLFNDVLPLDDVDSGAIEVAGRFAELVDRVQNAVDALSAPKTIDAWAAAIADAADALTATTERDAWQRAELDRLLGDVVAEAENGSATSLVPAEIRALLAERLKGRPTRANFRTGHLTICTLMPMRSVPHRVVCLLGMDDGVFPRKSPRDGDDLMLADPHVGDRDARTEDRQLLLDALLAATDQLIVTYTGNDERTNLVRPPAVPIGELLDVVDRTVRTDEGRARDRVETRHPLQPFDPKNFTPGELMPAHAWSFDPVTLHGARALTTERAPAAPFLAGPLPAATATLVELEDLVRFAGHPVRAFLRQRLGISVGDYADEVADALPVELDALERWGVGQRLLDGVLAGASIEACIAAEIARGMLPPGQLAKPVIARVSPVVAHIAAAAQAELDEGAEPASVDVKVALADGRTLSGTVPGVHGDVLRTVTYSRVNARHRLTAYVRWLALTAAHPERPFAAATIGQARRGASDSATITIARIPPLAEEAGARADTGAGAARDARRPLRPRHARAAPARLHDLGGLRQSRPRGRRRRQGRAQRVGVGLELPEGGRRARAPARPRGRPELRRASGRAAARGRAAATAGTTPRRPASAATRSGCGTRSSEPRRSSSGEHADRHPALRRLRPAADRGDGPRGERRHRQDVHDRRPGRALRRRGDAARAAAARDLHAHGDRRAARARPRAAGQRRAGARPRAGRRAADRRGRRAAREGLDRTRSAQRRENLTRALADFDAATIATTHGFCQEVLGGLGVAGDVDPDATFVEDVGDVLAGRRRRPLRAALARPRRPAVRSRAGAADRSGRGREPGRARGARARSGGNGRSDAPAAGARRARRARAPQAPDGGDDLRRPPHAPGRHAQRPRWRGRGRSACASATASCSSTSSRTPTRSSGTSCAARSATAA